MRWKQCNHPGCLKLIPNKPGTRAYCKKHYKKPVRKKTKTKRKDDSKLYHTKKWQDLRKLKLSLNPLCEECEKYGRLTQGEIIHHIIPLKADESKALDLDNLQTVCRKCHDKIHKKLDY